MREISKVKCPDCRSPCVFINPISVVFKDYPGCMLNSWSCTECVSFFQEQYFFMAKYRLKFVTFKGQRTGI